MFYIAKFNTDQLCSHFGHPAFYSNNTIFHPTKALIYHANNYRSVKVMIHQVQFGSVLIIRAANLFLHIQLYRYCVGHDSRAASLWSWQCKLSQWKWQEKESAFCQKPTWNQPPITKNSVDLQLAKWQSVGSNNRKRTARIQARGSLRGSVLLHHRRCWLWARYRRRRRRVGDDVTIVDDVNDFSRDLRIISVSGRRNWFDFKYACESWGRSTGC